MSEITPPVDAIFVREPAPIPTDILTAADPLALGYATAVTWRQIALAAIGLLAEAAARARRLDAARRESRRPAPAPPDAAGLADVHRYLSRQRVRRPA